MSDDFVNRHGHKVGATLEKAPAPEPFTPPTAPAKPQKVKKVRNKKPLKKRVVTVIVILAILVVLPILGGELVRAGYLSSRDNARAQLVNYATKTVVPEQKKQMTLAQLSDAAQRVEQIRDGTCQGGIMDNLAMLYPRAKQAHDDCITFKHKVTTIAGSLRDIEAQARYLDALAQLLAPVAKDTTEGFAIISAQHENWRALDEGLAKLSPAASQRAAHNALRTQAKAINNSWSALDTANNNQDSAGFTNAEKKLGDNYEAFRASSATFTSIMNDSQTNLTIAYKSL